MEPQKTKPAIELPKLLGGLALIVLAIALIAVDVMARPAFILIILGGLLALISFSGKACVDCNKKMQCKEFGFEEGKASNLSALVQAKDPSGLAEMISAGTINNKTIPRANLSLYLCAKCKQVTHATASTLRKSGGSAPAYEEHAMREIVGPEVKKLIEVAEKTHANAILVS
jgi:hypothetical protein